MLTGPVDLARCRLLPPSPPPQQVGCKISETTERGVQVVGAKMEEAAPTLGRWRDEVVIASERGFAAAKDVSFLSVVFSRERETSHKVLNPVPRRRRAQRKPAFDPVGLVRSALKTVSKPPPPHPLLCGR